MLPLYFMLIMTFHPRPALASSKSATFELSLYTTITEVSPRDSNLALSSLSAQNAVLMAHLGSCNATRSEFETLFSVPRSRVSADSIIKNHLRVIQTKVPRMSHLLSANAAFLDSKYSINPKYRNALERIFHANVTSLGISSNPDAAVRVVNSFVARVTKNNIPEILAPGGLKPTDKIVLVNALYFKARWLQPFDRQHTAYKRFTQESGEVKSVPTMNLRRAFNYFESEKIGAQFLELSYANSTTKMILVLPLQRGNLSAVEQAMSTVEGEKVFAKRWPEKTVIVILPKFRITQTLDLKEVLERMGVKKAFSASTADFCGISKHNDLYISKAVQKVFVEVDEKGTEAAAATAMVGSRRSLKRLHRSENDVVFRADHPFLFFIRDMDSDLDKTVTVPIIMGRVSEPLSRARNNDADLEDLLDWITE